MKQLGISFLILIAFVAMLFLRESTVPAQADQLDSNEKLEPPFGRALDTAEASGKITMLRVHDVGTGYGPLDVEVVITLDSEPNKGFGFQLRDDANRPVRQGMLDLLRDAFNNNWTVTIDYDIKPGEAYGVIWRLWLTK